jgi:1,4-dihydroxy-2-naphthoyl-CoA hydrolase
MDKFDFIKKACDDEMMRFLGVSIDVVTPERVVLTMEVTPKACQYFGILHGGISVYLAESAASMGTAAATDLTKFAPVGIEINANHLRSISKGTIKVEATRLYPGRTLNVWNIEITNDKGKLVCISRCTMLLQRHAAFQTKIER